MRLLNGLSNVRLSFLPGFIFFPDHLAAALFHKLNFLLGKSVAIYQPSRVKIYRPHEPSHSNTVADAFNIQFDRVFLVRLRKHIKEPSLVPRISTARMSITGNVPSVFAPITVWFFHLDGSKGCNNFYFCSFFRRGADFNLLRLEDDPPRFIARNELSVP